MQVSLEQTRGFLFRALRLRHSRIIFARPHRRMSELLYRMSESWQGDHDRNTSWSNMTGHELPTGHRSLDAISIREEPDAAVGTRH